MTDRFALRLLLDNLPVPKELVYLYREYSEFITGFKCVTIMGMHRIHCIHYLFGIGYTLLQRTSARFVVM